MSIDWEDKAWGRVRHVFVNPRAAVSFLEVKSETRCSRHKHESRINAFTSITAEIVIESWVQRFTIPYHIASGVLYTSLPSERDIVGPQPIFSTEEVDTRECRLLQYLRPGDSCVVDRLVEHRFRVLRGGEVVEVYWTENGEDVSLDDIVRVDEGGADDLYELRKEMGLGD